MEPSPNKSNPTTKGSTKVTFGSNDNTIAPTFFKPKKSQAGLPILKNSPTKTKQKVSNDQKMNEQSVSEKIPQQDQDISIDKTRIASFDQNEPFFSIEMTKKHSQASRVVRDINHLEKRTNREFCPCCSRAIPIKGEEIPIIGNNTKDLAHLGFAYPLYFQFLRFSIMFLIIILTMSGIYNLIENFFHSTCLVKGLLDSQQSCGWMLRLALQKPVDKNVPRKAPIFNLCATAALILFSTYFRLRQLIIANKLKRSQTIISPSKFTVFVNKFPKCANETDMKKFFEEAVKNVKVEKITMVFKMETYLKLIDSLRNPKLSKEEKKSIRTQLDQHEKDCLQGVDYNATSTGAAFVSFSTKEQANRVYQHFQKPLMSFLLWRNETDPLKMYEKKVPIRVKQAYEPADTNWQSIYCSNTYKYSYRIFTTLATLAVVGIAFLSHYQIKTFQARMEKTDMTEKLISKIPIIVVVVINQLVQFLIYILIEKESFNFKTETYISAAWKSGLAQFLNTTIVSFLIQLMSISDNQDEHASQTRLAENISMLLIVNSLFTPIHSLVPYGRIVKWVKQLWFRMMSEEKKQSSYTQIEVNQLFEKPTMNLASQFAKISNILLAVCFYAPFIPVGVAFGIVSIILQFFVDKFNLVRMMSVPPPIGVKLAERMIDFYLQSIIVVFSIGCLVFELIITKDTSVLSYLQVFISLVFKFMPIHRYLSRIMRLGYKGSSTEITYQDAFQNGWFITDYDRENPILKSNAIARYNQQILLQQKKQNGDVNL